MITEEARGFLFGATKLPASAISTHPGNWLSAGVLSCGSKLRAIKSKWFEGCRRYL
jgi:hypothetical protein